jgi:hypothetical protein
MVAGVDRLRGIWNGFFFTGFSGESLAMLRICFGVGLFFFHFTQFNFVFEIDLAGAHFRYLEPMWHFDLLGVDRHHPLLSYLALAALLLATIAMTLGYRTRMAIVLVLLGIFYLKGVRDSFTGDVHHRYLVPVHMLFLLLLSRCGALRSVDARRNATPRVVQEWQASWPIKAMQVYCVSFYFWAGVAKLRMSGLAWVDGRTIQDLLIGRSLLWGATESGEPAFNPLPYWVAQHETLCLMLAVGTLIMELGFPLLLLFRTDLMRLLALVGVGIFHIMNAVLAYVGFGLFPIVFLIFFDLEDVRRRLRTLWRSPPSVAPDALERGEIAA